MMVSADNLSGDSAPAAPPPQMPPSEPSEPRQGGFRVLIWALALVAILLAVGIGAAVLVRFLQSRAKSVPNAATPAARTVPQLIARLCSGPDAAARRAAAGALVATGPDAVLAALDEVAEVRPDGSAMQLNKPAVEALAAQAQGAVSTLAEALASSKPDVRLAAAAVLREMGPAAAEAVGPLASALQDENRWVRWNAAEALGAIGPKAQSAVDGLLAAARHNDRYTRRRAITALGRIGPDAQAAVAALKQIAREDRDPGTRLGARTALYQIDLERIAAQSAAEATPEVRDLIARLKSDDPPESVAAANGLARLGPQAAAAVPALVMALRREDKWVRVAAAEALGAIGRLAQPALVDLRRAAEAADDEVRAAAVQAIEQIEAFPSRG